jgi:hypothetical protein
MEAFDHRLAEAWLVPRKDRVDVTGSLAWASALRLPA